MGPAPLDASSLTNTISLVCVDPARVREAWPYAKDLIRSAVERTGLGSFKCVENDVLCGDQLLWLAWDGKILAAVTTRLADNGTNKVCEIVACAGECREKWLPLIARIEKYATDEGCSAMRIIGRRGWSRALPDYKSRYEIMEKPLGRQ